MNTSTNKKVICVKDIPSNVIEEAIFILKSDVENQNKKLNLIRKEIILKETDDLVREYSEEFDKFEIEENRNKVNLLNNFKVKMVLTGILVVLVSFLISMIVKL